MTQSLPRAQTQRQLQRDHPYREPTRARNGRPHQFRDPRRRWTGRRHRCERRQQDRTVRDFVVAAADASQEQSIVESVRSLPGVRVIDVADRTFQLHRGGKIEVTGRCTVKTSEDLSMV